MNLDEIQGAQRVAAFLLSLDTQEATRLIGTLAEDVVADVARAMVDLDPELSEPGRAEELRRELAVHANRPKTVRPCDTGELQDLLSAGLGPTKSAPVIEDVYERRVQERPFLELESASPAALAAVLGSESAAVCALVLAHVSPSLAAGVLQALDDEAALDVVRRMAFLKPPGFQVLREIAGTLTARLEAQGDGGGSGDGGARLKTIAELLNFSDAEMEKNVIEAIQEDDAEMADALREYMFTWEDIGTIDKRAMQKILGAVDTKTLSMALKGCSEPVEENVMSNLSQRVREMVKEERDLVGAVPLSEVIAARDEIMRSVRALIESGEFKPSRGGEELVE